VVGYGRMVMAHAPLADWTGRPAGAPSLPAAAAAAAVGGRIQRQV